VTRFEERLEIDRPIDEVFDFLADLSTTAEWDPGILEARRGEDGPIGVGSTFHLVASFDGRRVGLTYTTTFYDRPRRFVVDGVGPRFHGVDDIRFADTGDGRTVVLYLANLKLTGIAKLAQPFVAGRFDALVRTAVAGLVRTLERPGG
jgi:carbon monoxide dehydrogenase subunit G